MQWDVLLCTKTEPVVFILFYTQQAGTGTAITTTQVKITHLHIMQFPTTALCFQQHSEAGVFLDIDGRDWVHYDAELDHSSLLTGTSFIPDRQTAPAKQ
ncbi:Uncharacterised protein [Yersinia enterocolitica]|nr:Uncharacterised protein [Yersinia enterocolitica]